MTSYTRPGVFVNQTLTPLTTSPSGVGGGAIACFAAPFNQGPTAPTLVSSFGQFTNAFGTFATAAGSPLHYAVYQFFNNGGSSCYVMRVPNTDAVQAVSASIPSVEQTTGDDPVPTTADVLTFTALYPGAAGNSIYYEIVPSNPGSGPTGAGTGNADGTAAFTLNIYNGGTRGSNLVETWPAVSMNPNSARYLLSLLNSQAGGSSYVRAAAGFAASAYETGGAYDPVGNSGSPVSLLSGADGSTPPGDATFASAVTTGYTGANWSTNGFSALPATQVITLNLPGSDVTVYNSVITWAEDAGNAFLVIDGPQVGPSSSSSAVAQSYVGLVSGGAQTLTSTSSAAVYGPWLSIPDPASSSPTATVWVAPGGAVMGQYAANDAAYNVAQAPAGVQASVIATSLEANFSPTDLSTLQQYQINPIKLVPSSGYCIFGAQTLASGYPNQFVNVARTLMQFSNDFIRITQYAIFQNNDPTLWASIATTLNNYLNQAMQANMLASTDASSAYSVVCDDTINTAASAQAGLVNAQVAVALVSPAEFIVINLSQFQGGASATVSS